MDQEFHRPHNSIIQHQAKWIFPESDLVEQAFTLTIVFLYSILHDVKNSGKVLHLLKAR
jgi:hypothetical protein